MDPAETLFGPARPSKDARLTAFTRLRRALDHESLLNANAAAREMPRVGLSEALELLVLIHAHDRTRFSRAALRWHSRFERELDVTLEESLAVLAALAAMTGPAWRSAASALAVLVGGRRKLRQGAEALVRRGTSR